MVRQFLFDLLIAQGRVVEPGKYTLLVSLSVSDRFLQGVGICEFDF